MVICVAPVQQRSPAKCWDEERFPANEEGGGGRSDVQRIIWRWLEAAAKAYNEMWTPLMSILLIGYPNVIGQTYVFFRYLGE